MGSRASERFTALAGASTDEWERIFATGEAPSFDGMAGWEFRVWNAAPALLAALRLRKLIKVFFRDSAGGPAGCNTLVAQNGLEGPWTAKPDGRPTRFAFFRVTRDERHPHALLLDYGRVRGRLSLLNGLRDYVVRVQPGSDDLLLGKAYYGAGPLRIRVIWFLLERHRRVEVENEVRRRG